jgi:hypothetical protein
MMLRPPMDKNGTYNQWRCDADIIESVAFRGVLRGGGFKGDDCPPINPYLRNRLYVRYTFQIFSMWIILYRNQITRGCEY